MSRSIFDREELYDSIVNITLETLGDSVLAVVLFGSSVYLGRGEDIDVLIVVNQELNVKQKLRIEHEITSKLQSRYRNITFDVHIVHIQDLQDNIKGGFLAGLALGYKILLDKCSIEDKILRGLEEIAKLDKLVLVNEYGRWNISHYARILLKKKRFERSS